MTISDAQLKQLAILNGAQKTGQAVIASYLAGLVEPGGPPSNEMAGASLVIDGTTGEVATHAFVFVQARRDASLFKARVSFAGAAVPGDEPGVTINGNDYTHTIGIGEGYGAVGAALKAAIEAAEPVSVVIESDGTLTLTGLDGIGGDPLWSADFTAVGISDGATIVIASPDSTSVSWRLWGRLANPSAPVLAMLDPTQPETVPTNPLAWAAVQGTNGTGTINDANAIFRIRCAGLASLFLEVTDLDGAAIVGIVPCIY